MLADYFIIANGTNESQVRALVDNVEETLGKAGYEVKQREGYGLGSWVLLDFGDIIVHVFDREPSVLRSGKNLERWQTGGSGRIIKEFKTRMCFGTFFFF